MKAIDTLDVRQRDLRYFLEWSARADAGVRSASERVWNEAFAREVQLHGALLEDPFWKLMGLVQECTVFMIQSGSRTASGERTAAHVARIRDGVAKHVVHAIRELSR